MKGGKEEEKERGIEVKEVEKTKRREEKKNGRLCHFFKELQWWKSDCEKFIERRVSAIYCLS